MEIHSIIAGIEIGILGAIFAGAAASALITYFLTPKPNLGNQSRGRSGNIKSAEAPQQIVYGWTTKGGILTYINGTGADNTFLHQILIVASHEVEKLADIRLNGENVETVAFIGATTEITTHVNRIRDSVSRDSATKYGTNVRFNRMLGSTDQAIDPAALAENAILTANHRARGHAGIYSRYQYDQDIFTSFIPVLTAEVFGKKIFDPRDDAMRWTYNNALIISDILEGYFGVDRTRIDEATLIASADICDTMILTKASDSEPTYSANGMIELDGSWEEYLTPCINAMAGALVEWGGIYYIHAGAWTEPVLTITDNDFMGPISRQISGSDQDRANSAKGTYISPSSYDQETEFPPVKDAVAIAQDGGRVNWLEVDLEMVNTHTQAQRVAHIFLQESRRDEAFTVALPLHVGLDVKTFDNVRLQSDIFGIDETYRVVEHRIIPRSGRNGAYSVELTLKRHDEEVYDWNPATQEKDIQNAKTNLPGVGSKNPSGSTYGLTIYSSNADHKAGAAEINWTDPIDGFEAIEIEATMNVECRVQDDGTAVDPDPPVPGPWVEVAISEIREVNPDIETITFDFEDETQTSGPYDFQNHTISQARIRARLDTNTFGDWIAVAVE